MTKDCGARRLRAMGLAFAGVMMCHAAWAQYGIIPTIFNTGNSELREIASKSAQAASPFVFSANNSADYGTSIAQGSLFVVFGSALGPATLNEVSSFPLPSTLAGTSVSVTSGGTTLSCPMIYTSASQVAAVLPSNTPLGQARLTVSYGGSAAPIGAVVNVVKSAVGIYTTTSSGLGLGIATALDGTLKTYANVAKQGEIVTVWATGLGGINSPDNTLPTSFPSFPNVQVWVGANRRTSFTPEGQDAVRRSTKSTLPCLRESQDATFRW